MELDVTNNTPRPCGFGPCTLAWDLVEYPQSVFYDSRPNPQTGVTSIYMSLIGNSVKRVDGPFSTLQSLSIVVCETCLNSATTSTLSAIKAKSVTKRTRPSIGKQPPPVVVCETCLDSGIDGSSTKQISAVFTDIRSTVTLVRGADGLFRGQILFDSSKISRLSFHFVADGKATPELTASFPASEINSGLSVWQASNPCPSQWAAFQMLQEQIVGVQDQIDGPTIPAGAKKALGTRLRGLTQQLGPTEDKLRACIAPPTVLRSAK
jgi:hypothetical protein